MATTSKRKTIREASSSVQGRQAERTRAPIARQPAAPSATGPSRVGARSQPQGGPKLNELRGKLARLEQERLQSKADIGQHVAAIEALLDQLSATPVSVVQTDEAIRIRCMAIREVLG